MARKPNPVYAVLLSESKKFVPEFTKALSFHGKVFVLGLGTFFMRRVKGSYIPATKEFKNFQYNKIKFLPTPELKDATNQWRKKK